MSSKLSVLPSTKDSPLGMIVDTESAAGTAWVLPEKLKMEVGESRVPEVARHTLSTSRHGGDTATWRGGGRGTGKWRWSWAGCEARASASSRAASHWAMWLSVAACWDWAELLVLGLWVVGSMPILDRRFLRRVRP
ncbi:ribosomal RNA small subunit methyltransferase H [Striga asiatica]|uniref:Ribosomal RNA small subunit methyltransferase H n=1 Tax=Striga asiatica TaxID=4170 RepID=A0A5A7QPA7_STRAF|nr:ribosomal RNA small subunit methyltransferase H [Striga asiatica]